MNDACVLAGFGWAMRLVAPILAVTGLALAISSLVSIKRIRDQQRETAKRWREILQRFYEDRDHP